MPVVLIHGTASSPARWADLVNELENDPKLRDRIDFWLLTYNTSNPVLLSARDLRASLQRVVQERDPLGRDPVLRQVVLIGHSQGGLLTRLMVTDSGSRFWASVTDAPFEKIEVSEDRPRSHALTNGSFCLRIPRDRDRPFRRCGLEREVTDPVDAAAANTPKVEKAAP